MAFSNSLKALATKRTFRPSRPRPTLGSTGRLRTSSRRLRSRKVPAAGKEFRTGRRAPSRLPAVIATATTRLDRGRTLARQRGDCAIGKIEAARQNGDDEIVEGDRQIRALAPH